MDYFIGRLTEDAFHIPMIRYSPQIVLSVAQCATISFEFDSFMHFVCPENIRIDWTECPINLRIKLKSIKKIVQ